MAGFFNKLKGAGLSVSSQQASQNKKKDDAALEVTPLEKMLQNSGPMREDGTDKFFGLENFGNTCYCNSIVQALYHSSQFRENVLKYTPFAPELTNGSAKVNVQIRAPTENGADQSHNKTKGLSQAEALKRRQAINGVTTAAGGGLKPEDKPDSPEYKKKQALQKGPVLELTQGHPSAYGMGECTFTGLKDIFASMIESSSRTGVVSPQRFLEIFKRDNENFRTSMHQDAHEFYGLVLNDVITTIEENARKVQELENSNLEAAEANGHAVAPAAHVQSLSAGWVHDIFEGVLTSETKCLACETTSQRDEKFLDLSIDLEQHSSVTACLNNFSAEEMLCEKNKFQCDTCGGLQEAEKRMKIKTMPRVLALHLKRFKYTEDYSRLQKLFHRVVYPYYLRMFNTTDDVADPDRLYELYAVVIHIGGNAYHGHYVSVIKTQDRGWLLFDDEMVEPVDKHFVKNFFGDKPGMACAYLLLYQETTFDQALADQDAEGYLDVGIDNEGRLSVGETHTMDANGMSKQPTAPQTNSVDPEPTDSPVTPNLEHAKTEPFGSYTNGHATEPASSAAPEPLKRADTVFKSKTELKKEAKAQKLAEKEAEKAEIARRREATAKLREARATEIENMELAIQLSLKTANGNGNGVAPRPAGDEGADPLPATSHLLRSSKGSMAKRSLAFLGKDKDKKKDKDDKKEHRKSESHAVPPLNGDRSVSSPIQLDKLMGRFGFGLSKKKSSPALS